MNQELPENTKMIFLVGAQRSGTTWLQLLLSASPSIATVTETYLFAIYTESFFSGWRRLRDQKSPIGLHNIMSEAAYLALIRELASKVMSRIFEMKQGATIILEETPDHAKHWRNIMAVFSDAYFIHLIRDPRAVVASLRAARHILASDWVSPRIADNCSFWADRVEAGREIAAATKNYLEVRYEDLKRDGVRTLRSIFAWCGISIADSEVTEILRENQIHQLRSRAGEAWPFHGGEGFFRNGEGDSWRSDLTPWQTFLVERMTAALMADLGYAPVHSGRPRLSAALSSIALFPMMASAAAAPWLSMAASQYGDALSRGR